VGSTGMCLPNEWTWETHAKVLISVVIDSPNGSCLVMLSEMGKMQLGLLSLSTTLSGDNSA